MLRLPIRATRGQVNLLCLFAMVSACSLSHERSGRFVDGAVADDGAGAAVGNGSNDESNGFAAGPCGGWLDEKSGLCWQDPPPDTKFSWDKAKKYCGDLAAHGRDDWRMPAIDELVSLIRGCAHVSCDLADPGCLTDDCQGDCITPCIPDFGPGAKGCFWPADLNGSCADQYFSSSAYADTSNLVWSVDFYNGAAARIFTEVQRPVRCVR